MTAITLAVGFAVWDWARSATVSSENNFGFYSIGTSVNSTIEKLVIVNANFSSTATKNVTLWFYNYGNTTAYVSQIWISNVSSSSPWTNTTQKLSNTLLKVNCKTSTSCLSTGYYFQIQAGAVKMLALNVNSAFKTGVAYQFKALTIYGNSYTYLQSR